MTYEPFHIRQAIADGEVPDVYIYDVFSPELRNRLGMMFLESLEEMNRLGIHSEYLQSTVTKIIHLCNKYINAQITLPYNSNFRGRFREVNKYIKLEKDPSKIISAMEIICKEMIDFTNAISKDLKNFTEEIINEMNSCLKTYGLGYEYLIEQNIFIKISSKHTHKNIIKPAFGLLHDPVFKSAENDFEVAFEHYRNGKFGDAIVRANSSFEGVMKIICDARNWKYGKGLTNDLVEILFKNEFIPKVQQKYFKNLKDLLKTGVTPMRNMKGGHAIVDEKNAPLECQVEYVLDTAASCIKLLVKYHNLQNKDFHTQSHQYNHISSTQEMFTAMSQIEFANFGSGPYIITNSNREAKLTSAI